MMSDPTSEITMARLTKSFYLSLPTGVYLVSNLGWAPDKPLFADRVVQDSERINQWRRIVGSGAAQRLCNVFSDEGQYAKWRDASLKRLKTEIIERSEADEGLQTSLPAKSLPCCLPDSKKEEAREFSRPGPALDRSLHGLPAWD
jgi:hypothetical protein